MSDIDLSKTTPGPWSIIRGTGDMLYIEPANGMGIIAQMGGVGDIHTANAALIASAPALAARVERLEVALGEAREFVEVLKGYLSWIRAMLSINGGSNPGVDDMAERIEKWQAALGAAAGDGEVKS